MNRLVTTDNGKLKTNIRLSKYEIEELTGKKQPAKQLEMLLKRGFYRAFRLDVTGEVVLERAHYEAVCTGSDKRLARPIPKVRKIRHEEATI